MAMALLLATRLFLPPAPYLAFLNSSEVSLRADIKSGQDPTPLVWTNDFASLWHILKK